MPSLIARSSFENWPCDVPFSPKVYVRLTWRGVRSWLDLGLGLSLGLSLGLELSLGPRLGLKSSCTHSAHAVQLYQSDIGARE